MTYAQQALALVQQNHMVAESWELYTNGMLDIPGDDVPVAGELRNLNDFIDHPHLTKEAELASPPPHPRLSEALAVVARYHGEQLDEVLDLLAIKELDEVLPLTVLAEMIASRVKAIRTENAYVGFLPMPQLPKHEGSLLDVGFGRKPELDKLGPFDWPTPVLEPGIQPEHFTGPRTVKLAISDNWSFGEVDVSQGTAAKALPVRAIGEAEVRTEVQLTTGTPSRLPHHVPRAEYRGNPLILERMKEVVKMDRVQLVDDAARGTGYVQPGLVALARCWYEHCVGEKRAVTEGHPRLHQLLTEAVVSYRRDLLKQQLDVLKQLEVAGFDWGFNKDKEHVILNKGNYSLVLHKGQPVVPEVKGKK